MSDSSHNILIGVDGGGTGCRVAIGTAQDGVVATAEGGRANPASEFEIALKNIDAVIRAAATKAGLPQSALPDATAHLGLAGVMTQSVGTRIVKALGFKRAIVTDDRTIAVCGALGGHDGFLLSVGTGTIAAATKDGVDRAVGGWGFQVSDQASGAWLGRKALEHTLLCHDGLARHTDLSGALLAEFDNDPNNISTFSIRAQPGDFGAFAPQIVAAARDGDHLGQSLMQSGSNHLIRCLETLGFTAGDRLCLTGGVGPHYASYLPSEVLTGQQNCLGSALDGAFQLAKRAATKTKETAS